METEAVDFPRGSQLPRRRRGDTTSVASVLHNPHDSKALTDLLQDSDEETKIYIDRAINSKQDRFDRLAPIHSIIINKKGRKRFDCLMSLLINSIVDVNLQADHPDLKKMSALHILMTTHCHDKDRLLAVKAIIAFGAELNQLNTDEKSPLDLVCGSQQYDLVALLQDLDAKCAAANSKMFTLPRLPPFPDSEPGFIDSCENEDTATAKLASPGPVTNLEDLSKSTLVRMAEVSIRKEQVQKPVEPMAFSDEGGSRVLFLDGGGIKGLNQIEFLIQLEKETGRRVTELFDWIVGTSTGALIALAMVYAQKTLPQLRQLYFKLKDTVFSSPSFSVWGDNYKELEKLLIDIFGPTLKMTDVKYPKVLISSVKKDKTPLKLVFFNNCFDADYEHPISDTPVWEVARCTTAAPMHFPEYRGHVDGGLLANNPCVDGLKAIHDFYRKRQGKKKRIAIVVSVGSGKSPDKKLGDVNLHERLDPKGLFSGKVFSAAKNLFSMLETAIVDPDIPAEQCRTWCRELNIPFYRFSPQLPQKIEPGERDNVKLVDMIVEMKKYMQTVKIHESFDELVQRFHRVVQLNRDDQAKKRVLQSSASPLPLTDNT